MSINLLRHTVYYFLHSKSATCVISIIIDAPTVLKFTTKQIDLQVFFVTTSASLCQCIIVNKQM